MSYKSGWITDGNVRVNLADSEILTRSAPAPGYDEVKMFDSVFNDGETAERLSATMDARGWRPATWSRSTSIAATDSGIWPWRTRRAATRRSSTTRRRRLCHHAAQRLRLDGAQGELYNEVAPDPDVFHPGKDFEDIQANSTRGGADVVKFKDGTGPTRCMPGRPTPR